jgi:hypothetical protein
MRCTRFTLRFLSLLFSVATGEIFVSFFPNAFQLAWKTTVGCDQILFGFLLSSRVSHPLFSALVPACERASKEEGGEKGAKRQGNTDEADFVEGP